MDSPSPDKELESFNRSALLLFMFVISVAFLWMTRHLIMPVLLGAIFSGLTYPLYLRFLRIPRIHPASAAALTLIALAMVTLVPLAIFSSIAYHQSANFLATIDLQELQAKILAFLEILKTKFPQLFGNLDAASTVQEAIGYIQKELQQFLKYATSLSLSFLEKILGTFITLFSMFYFYIEGEKFLKQLIKWSPLRDEFDEILLSNFISVTKGTLKASIVIGIINGTLASLIFWSVGLGSPVFLGSLIFIGTFIPVIGGGPVWFPAAVYLMLHQHWAGAFTILIGCGIILHAIHSFLLPILIGKDAKMHNLLVLMSTLGGIFAFGFIGVIIGPIIGAMFLSIWKIYGQVFAREISHNKKR